MIAFEMNVAVNAVGHSSSPSFVRVWCTSERQQLRQYRNISAASKGLCAPSTEPVNLLNTDAALFSVAEIAWQLFNSFWRRGYQHNRKQRAIRVKKKKNPHTLTEIRMSQVLCRHSYRFPFPLCHSQPNILCIR